MTTSAKLETWSRLVTGPRGLAGRLVKRLEEVAYGRRIEARTKDGRLDLRDLVVPEPQRSRGPVVGGNVISRLEAFTELRGRRLTRLDLSGARLPSFRLIDCVIEDCRFDGAVCQDLRLWGTVIRDCSFEGADLRESALGGTSGRKRNRFERVRFDRADLRGTVHSAAAMNSCSFAGADLTKVEFNGTVFEACRFSGRLQEVSFHRQGFGDEGFPPNEMKDVDFTEAEFSWVDFRGLELHSVRWPKREDHLVFDDFHPRVDRVIAFVADRTDLESRAARAVFEHMRKWSPPGRRTGVVNLTELAAPEFAGAELAARIVEILRG